MIFNPGAGGSGGVKIQAGSYVGSGGTQRTITLEIEPVLFALFRGNSAITGDAFGLIWIGQDDFEQTNNASITVSGNSITITGSNYNFAMNAIGTTYNWLAIG